MDTLKVANNTARELFLESFLAKAFSEGCPFAVWKKPGQSLVEMIMDRDPKAFTSPEVDLDELPEGFMIHPFLNSEVYEPVYIKASRYERIFLGESSTTDEGDWSSNETILEGSATTVRNKIAALPVGPNGSPSKKADFLATVANAIDHIQSGDFYKVVPARLKKLRLSPEFDLARVFLELCDAYPSAFVNCFFSETSGCWIGASPETLIRTKGDLFYTMALAGTQKAQGDNPLKNAAWTQKEIEEQALVSRYIVNCFKKIRLREYQELGPKTSVAGGLLHLKSEFLVDMKATNFPQLGSVMLGLLHPTSAVCGMPKEKALDFIKAEEGFDRSYFSGFIGPVNLNGETSLFVNLRCAKLENNEALLYAGAGITEDSVPEKEWEETELKCDIIGKFIQTTKSH
ncbi:chorismate-binding protein [Cyclobacterium jeungdonense]|uniref:Chorismate-binding protein n=1 Tax=Cyclobacterium jeungdonense TaxID=708087 RepID=A0ABT8CAB7_9BACT|nr:chorismate-binding protein [Cyclobacterium jeungdonense]MDN3689297.1 chorismate-binding protein [Cyclobacterium jeungdonense]